MIEADPAVESCLVMFGVRYYKQGEHDLEKMASAGSRQGLGQGFRVCTLRSCPGLKDPISWDPIGPCWETFPGYDVTLSQN